MAEGSNPCPLLLPNMLLAIDKHWKDLLHMTLMEITRYSSIHLVVLWSWYEMLLTNYTALANTAAAQRLTRL